MDVLRDIKRSPISRKPNYIKIPVTAFSMTEEGVEQFNKVFLWLKDYCKSFNTIKRTKSGGISIDHIRLPQWDVRLLTSCVEVTVLSIDGMFRVQLRTGVSEDKQAISGRKCFWIFKDICSKFGINLDDYTIENGKEFKEAIVQPPIKLYRPTNKGKIYSNVHHIDLNSSFCAGIAEYAPALQAPIEHIYNNRKKYPVYKDILTHTQGFMQSSIVGYRWAHLSKAGIDSNNRKIAYLTDQLLAKGFVILAYNTDGIWYTHPNGYIYHDEYEGTKLGMWKTDHKYCTWQAKSDGAYHFIENGKCHTVLRGRTRLDRIKRREDWTWDDLNLAYADIMKVNFSFEEGAWITYE